MQICQCSILRRKFAVSPMRNIPIVCYEVSYIDLLVHWTLFCSQRRGRLPENTLNFLWFKFLVRAENGFCSPWVTIKLVLFIFPSVLLYLDFWLAIFQKNKREWSVTLRSPCQGPVIARNNNGAEWETPSVALWFVNFTNFTNFTNFKKLIWKLISREASKLLFSVVKREFNSRHYNIMHCLLWGSHMLQTVNKNV